MDSTYWNKIYTKKTETEVSWFQESPRVSLELISALNISKDAAIIDIGGGDSRFVDSMLELGFTNLTVLDISSAALERAQKRLGEKAKLVQWIELDVTHFVPDKKYDLWHDRAAFHFLVDRDQVLKYSLVAEKAMSDHGYLIIATFSKTGPEKCSGLSITQYSKESLNQIFEKNFSLNTCVESVHQTPFGTTQNFLFCSFKAKSHK